jgi:hypothetical protein
MLYVVEMYWPYLVAAVVLGICVGWWFQDSRSADDMTVWLEPGRDDE